MSETGRDELDEYLDEQMQNPAFRAAYERAQTHSEWVSASWLRRLADRWVPPVAEWWYRK